MAEEVTELGNGWVKDAEGRLRRATIHHMGRRLPNWDYRRELERPLGNAIGGFKTGCEKIYAKMGGVGRLFTEGFVDHVVLRAGQLAAEFNYLQDNPRRLAVKRLFPDLFKVSQRMAVTLRLAPQGQARQGASHGLAGGGALQGQAGGGAPHGLAGGGAVSLAPTARAVGYFASLGNPFLLGRPLAQVQVSRRFFGYQRVVKPGGGLKIARDAAGEPLVDFSTPEFEVRRDEFFDAAKHGAVLLSPCVSDGERQIAREALAAGLPLVTMVNKGFSPLQKPSGRYFAACADGKLLMLAPAAWPYQPGEKPMTRFDATAMNRLCQWIAGEGAAEINYHGMKPTNVDELAFAAACVSRGERRG